MSLLSYALNWCATLHPRKLLVLVLAFLASSDRAGAQASSWRDTVELVTQAPHHGLGGFSTKLRDDILADPQALALYEALLAGENANRIVWDTATVLWWLAESGNPRYASLFARYATLNARYDRFQMAVYGLARTAASGIARRHLLGIAQTGSPSQRDIILWMLGRVNDPAARGVLRKWAERRTDPHIAKSIRLVLSRTNVRKEKGRWPCLRGETLVADEYRGTKCLRLPGRAHF